MHHIGGGGSLPFKSLTGHESWEEMNYFHEIITPTGAGTLARHLDKKETQKISNRSMHPNFIEFHDNLKFSKMFQNGKANCNRHFAFRSMCPTKLERPHFHYFSSAVRSTRRHDRLWVWVCIINEWNVNSQLVTWNENRLKRSNIIATASRFDFGWAHRAGLYPIIQDFKYAHTDTRTGWFYWIV